MLPTLKQKKNRNYLPALRDNRAVLVLDITCRNCHLIGAMTTDR